MDPVEQLSHKRLQTLFSSQCTVCLFRPRMTMIWRGQGRLWWRSVASANVGFDMLWDAKFQYLSLIVITGNSTRGFCPALSPSRRTTGLTFGDAPFCACAWPPLFCRNITGVGWAVLFIAASGRKERSERKKRRGRDRRKKSRKGA